MSKNSVESRGDERSERFKPFVVSTHLEIAFNSVLTIDILDAKIANKVEYSRCKFMILRN